MLLYGVYNRTTILGSLRSMAPVAFLHWSSITINQSVVVCRLSLYWTLAIVKCLLSCSGKMFDLKFYYCSTSMMLERSKQPLLHPIKNKFVIFVNYFIFGLIKNGEKIKCCMVKSLDTRVT